MRVVRTAAATLRHTFEVDETATPSSTDVEVAVVDANGTTVASGTATPAGNTYTFLLPGQPDLTDLTVSWSGTIAGAPVVEEDLVPVVGRRLFSLAAARASDADLADEARYTTADLETARDEVEDELDEILLRSFVPRYRRSVLDGTGSTDLTLPDTEVREIRAATVAPRLDGTFVALSAGELAALAALDNGTLRRADGLAWTYGVRNVVVEYEYGTAAPPADLVKAAMIRLRSRLNLTRTGIPDRATSFSAADGGTYRLSLPEAYRTGIPEVDAVYDRYSRRSRGRKARPASRTLSYEPQANSLFHRR
jgi:hypothetical protein